ncbi:putative membrane protein [Clostridium sp. N3C]|uniref:DUF4870 domain-containing protein n=1 Tax=Clostridium sp. N3C TaxID=1776758 RepID=UPI00092E1DC8|nr:DUF4870 domain-containing protein [Clostridium sp. N3C]NLZ34230.1 DUF4870 domain-containing protein [Clostridiales bacterium]SCN21847.1 putative membrane protein [Clostridium sp. N3C]
MNQFNFNGKKSSTGLDENIAGLLCYVGTFITGLIFYFMEKDSRFVKFHALQSIMLFLSLSIVNRIFAWIPLLGGIITDLTGLLAFIFWILMMVKAYNGEWFKLPIIGEIADRNANV